MSLIKSITTRLWWIEVRKERIWYCSRWYDNTSASKPLWMAASIRGGIRPEVHCDNIRRSAAAVRNVGEFTIQYNNNICIAHSVDCWGESASWEWSPWNGFQLHACCCLTRQILHPPLIHSFISGMHHYECVALNRHHSPEWMILSHVSCLVQGEVHWFQVLLGSG